MLFSSKVSCNLQPHQGDSCLDFGEGRKGESAVLYIFAVWAALSDWPTPDDLPSNMTLAACQHLVVQSSSSTENFLSPLVNGSAQMCDLTRLNTVNKILLVHAQLFIEPCKHARCYHLTGAELILTHPDVSWKSRQIKFQLKFGPKCKCLPNYGLYTWPDAWLLFSGLQTLKKILQL